MVVSMEKGGRVSLTKVAADSGIALSKVVVGCGWDVNQKKGGFLSREKAYDLDLSAAGLDDSGQVPGVDDPTDRGYQEWFIWANHRFPSGKSLQFMGDNRTGEGEGDDEQIKVDLNSVPSNIVRIKFGVVIWRAEERKQKFGNVKNAFIRVFDENTGQEFARYDLGAEFSEETYAIFGELYRHNGEWKFRAIGEGNSAADYRRIHNIKHPFETEYARFSD